MYIWVYYADIIFDVIITLTKCYSNASLMTNWTFQQTVHNKYYFYYSPLGDDIAVSSGEIQADSADAHLLNAVRTCTSLLDNVQAEYASLVLRASIEAVQGDRCNRMTPYDDVNTKDIRQRIKTGSIFAWARCVTQQDTSNAPLCQRRRFDHEREPCKSLGQLCKETAEPLN